MYTERIIKDITEKQDEYLIEEVRKVGFLINKEELAKALKYDRDQYIQGYTDGRMYKPPIITNADLVRSMSNDNLATLFTEGCCRELDCPKEYFLEDGLNCYKCWFDWLNQEAE